MATKNGQKQFYYLTRLTTFKLSSDYLQFTLLVFPLRMMVRMVVRVIVMVVRIVGRMATMMVVMKEPIPTHTITNLNPRVQKVSFDTNKTMV